jgi:hypothetical protein
MRFFADRRGESTDMGMGSDRDRTSGAGELERSLAYPASVERTPLINQVRTTQGHANMPAWANEMVRCLSDRWQLINARKPLPLGVGDTHWPNHWLDRGGIREDERVL